MSSGRVHAIAGFVGGVVVAAHESKRNGDSPLVLLGSGAFSALATRLPDVLEPATSPNHRQFFHSLLFSAIVGKLTYDCYQWEAQTDSQKLVRYLLLLAGAAYLIHLVLDFGTPKGLPIIGN